MQVVCLYFPHLNVDLALAAHPELDQRPVVLVDRPGPEGLVTGRSARAAMLGILPAMSARTACDHAPSAVFLPDTAARARMKLAAIADSIREDGAGVPEVGKDHIAVHTGHYVASARVLDAARLANSGLVVRVGRGGSAAEALASARSARAEWLGARRLERHPAF